MPGFQSKQKFGEVYPTMRPKFDRLAEEKAGLDDRGNAGREAVDPGVDRRPRRFEIIEVTLRKDTEPDR